MEGLRCLKFPLEQDDLLCKIDLKEAYFSVPLNKNSQKFVWFQWSCNLDEFLCLCFGLGPAPRIFTKSIKVPIAFLRRVNIRIIIYLDDMLLLGRTLPEILIARDTMIYQLQHLGFVINLKKPVMHPVKQRVSGLCNRCRENDFCFFREKIRTGVSTMPGDFQATKNFSLRSKEQILALQKKRVLQWPCDTG